MGEGSRERERRERQSMEGNQKWKVEQKVKPQRIVIAALSRGSSCIYMYM